MMYSSCQSYRCKALDVIHVHHVTSQIKTSHSEFGNEINKTINSPANRTDHISICCSLASSENWFCSTSLPNHLLRSKAVKGLHFLSLEEMLFRSLKLEKAVCFLDGAKTLQAAVADEMQDSLGSGTLSLRGTAPLLR